MMQFVSYVQDIVLESVDIIKRTLHKTNNSIYVPEGNSALHFDSVHITFLQFFIFSQYRSLVSYVLLSEQ